MWKVWGSKIKLVQRKLDKKKRWSKTFGPNIFGPENVGTNNQIKFSQNILVSKSWGPKLLDQKKWAECFKSYDCQE